MLQWRKIDSESKEPNFGACRNAKVNTWPKNLFFNTAGFVADEKKISKKETHFSMEWMDGLECKSIRSKNH